MKKYIESVLFAVFAAATVLITVYFYTEKSECNDRGGNYVRSYPGYICIIGASK